MTPEQIAAGLTEAQKRQMTDDVWYGPHGWRTKHGSPALFAKGLTVGSSSRLTPLGLAVRQALQENSSG